MTRGQIQRGTFLLSGFPIGALLLSMALPQSNMPLPLDMDAPPAPIVETVPTAAPTPSHSEAPSMPSEEFDLGSGPRVASEMDQEWQIWTASDSSLHLNTLVIKEEMRLAAVLTEFQDLSNNPLRVQHILTTQADLPQRTDSVTFFNRNVDGLEEKNLRLGLVIPHRLLPSKDGLATSVTDHSYYSVSLKQSILKRPYDLRDPTARGEFAIANATDFNPILEFLAAARAADVEIFETEVQWGDSRLSLQAEARETEFGTLVIELRIRQLDSLQSQRVALIYE